MIQALVVDEPSIQVVEDDYHRHPAQCLKGVSHSFVLPVVVDKP
jgi:hypothetical protein